MVTPEEMQARVFTRPMPEVQKGYKQVTAAEMASFIDDYEELAMDFDYVQIVTVLNLW